MSPKGAPAFRWFPEDAPWAEIPASRSTSWSRRHFSRRFLCGEDGPDRTGRMSAGLRATDRARAGFQCVSHLRVTARAL
jgi:hypothetical protein